MDEKRCTCGTMDVRVVTCSGGSNVGQIANDAQSSWLKRTWQVSSAWRVWAAISREW